MADRKSTDGMLLLVERNIRRDEWMHWRTRRYGFPCLTSREYEAMVWEMHAIAPLAAPADAAMLEHWRTEAVQRSVALRMRVSQQRVSQILGRATDAMHYFEAHGIPAKWRVERGNWLLDAPCEDTTITIRMSYLVRANSRAMLKVG
jgi:hypothetical protein